MDETGMQLNNKPGSVVALKGSRSVTTLTACEGGETITVITCCNEGTPLIFDGHASHCNNLGTLKFVEDHDIILLCLLPHTTHYLQPLDRSVFKSLKSTFNAAAYNWVKTHDNRNISRLAFGSLLRQAWGRSATVQNAVSGFSTTGI
ncbi:unnamed protein product, partial [Tenebrio molitor]